jgi:translocator protein
MIKFSQISVIISTITVIFVNYLASTGYIGGITPDYLSKLYPTFVTPAGFAFTIWGWIYLGLIIFTIFQAMPSQADNYRKIRTIYVINCLANCVWILVWHNQLIVASVGAMLVLLASLIAININLTGEDSLIARVPFGMYFGWVTVATVVNITICLSSFGIKYSDSTSITIACLLIAVAAIIGVTVRLGIKNVAYGLAVAWGILGIAINYGGVMAISFVSAFAIIALLIAAITPLLRLNEAKR